MCLGRSDWGVMALIAASARGRNDGLNGLYGVRGRRVDFGLSLAAAGLP